ncbi:MAG: hypothetical protein PHR45_01395 [Muribaculaceae bacterium]|nr:hypothetical protein [Muribaculaceae bacterium]
MKGIKKRSNKWLLLSVIVLATLLILWLTVIEYFGAVKQGEVDKDAIVIEQTK